MTPEEWLALHLLRATSARGDAPISVLVADVRDTTARQGVLPESQVRKIDDVLVGRAMQDWARRQPPLVDFDFDPSDLLPHGNVRPGAERRWSLTDAGDDERRRLERQAGVVD